MNELITNSHPSSVDVANAWMILDAEGAKLKRLRAEILVQYEPAPVVPLNIALFVGGAFTLITGLVIGSVGMYSAAMTGVAIQVPLDPFIISAGGLATMLPAGLSLNYGEKLWGGIMKFLRPKKYRAKEARKKLDEKILPYLLQDFMNKTEDVRAVISKKHPSCILVMDRCVFTIAIRGEDSSKLNRKKQGIGTARIILESEPPATFGGISYTSILKELES